MSDAIVNRFLELAAPANPHIIDLYLFGSRARDDWRPDSDYDILVVVDERSRAVIDSLYDAVMGVLLETGRLVSLKIFKQADFDRLMAIPTPFMKNVLAEGKRLGTRVKSIA